MSDHINKLNCLFELHFVYLITLLKMTIQNVLPVIELLTAMAACRLSCPSSLPFPQSDGKAVVLGG